MIYVILLIGAVLVVINIRAIIKENNSFNKTYVSARDNITDYEIEIGKLRNEFAETLVELQSEIEELKRKVDAYENKNFINEEKKSQSAPLNSNNIKIEQVNTMFKEGKTVDDIAESLKLGKGEVLLIKELYLK